MFVDLFFSHRAFAATMFRTVGEQESGAPRGLYQFLKWVNFPSWGNWQRDRASSKHLTRSPSRKFSIFSSNTATDPFLQPSGAPAWLGAVVPRHGSVQQSRPSIDSSHTTVAAGGGAPPRSCLPACLRAGPEQGCQLSPRREYKLVSSCRQSAFYKYVWSDALHYFLIKSVRTTASSQRDDA